MKLKQYLVEIKSGKYICVFIFVFIFLIFSIYTNIYNCKKSIENMTILDNNKISDAIAKFYISDDFTEIIRKLSSKIKTSGLKDSGLQIVGNINVTGNIKSDGEISSKNISFKDFNIKIDEKIKELKVKAIEAAKAKAAAEKAAEDEYFKDFLYRFKLHNFDSNSSKGMHGPLNSDIKGSKKPWLEQANPWITKYLNINIRGIQEWTVPVHGIYKITAVGAKGGGSTHRNWQLSSSGGFGANVSIKYHLKKSNILKIIIGQNGLNSFSRGGGGGGGTFVILGDQLIIAAGGGGGGAPTSNGLNASLTTSGTDGISGQGGKDGNGGTEDNGNSGGGGGGFKSNGISNKKWYVDFIKIGNGTPGNFMGGMTSSYHYSQVLDGLGGFGGGGAGVDGGGGGGGYSGGGGGSNSGGGGGSYSITGKFDSQSINSIDADSGWVIIELDKKLSEKEMVEIEAAEKAEKEKVAKEAAKKAAEEKVKIELVKKVVSAKFKPFIFDFGYPRLDTLDASHLTRLNLAASKRYLVLAGLNMKNKVLEWGFYIWSNYNNVGINFVIPGIIDSVIIPTGLYNTGMYKSKIFKLYVLQENEKLDKLIFKIDNNQEIKFKDDKVKTFDNKNINIYEGWKTNLPFTIPNYVRARDLYNWDERYFPIITYL